MHDEAKFNYVDFYIMVYFDGFPTSTIKNTAATSTDITIFTSRYSVVGIATGYGLNDQEVRVRVPVGSRIFSSPHRPDRFRGPPSLLSNGFRGLFPWG
jgi:hypothetical protein